ncbi:C-type lectin domain family 4 member E-like [Epargyreus clarus]|uniref:C-type lectin domain family 4 member E-like n=1 Tax=Epargyreus clarus TaxID=520877 RepID=UPI003C2F5E01
MRKLGCLIVLSLVASLNAMRYRCDYTYYPEAEGWLKLHKVPANFQDARLRCDLEGGVLASPTTNGLNLSMLALIDKEMETKAPILTGIHATLSKGDFFTIEGVPLWRIHHKWAPYEPDNCDNNEQCITVFADGCLSDVNCNNTYPYICYKKAPRSVRVNECGTTDNEYYFEERTGSCYKFHKVPRVWDRANMACAAEGAHLVIINSNTEAQVIKEIFAKHPSSSYLSIYSSNYAFAGFYNWGEKGEWRTVDGRPIAEAGYDKFAPGEPNNVEASYLCGAVNRNALLDDNWCDYPHPFFCEKHPDSLLCENELSDS